MRSENVTVGWAWNPTASVFTWPASGIPTAAADCSEFPPAAQRHSGAHGPAAASGTMRGRRPRRRRTEPMEQPSQQFEDIAVQFDCEGQRLFGILSQPASPGRRGVLIVVGGPQYRAGSHRQFTLLARDLA